MDVLCTDKTGTLTESSIKLVSHVGVDGKESDEVFRLAYLNSAFESGIKSRKCITHPIRRCWSCVWKRFSISSVVPNKYVETHFVQ